MVRYCIASHKEFSIGTKQFLDFMVGENYPITTLAAFVDDKSITESVSECLVSIGEYDQLFVFCDIHGGSVAQEFFRAVGNNEKVKLIAGYNLAIVMEIIMRNSVLSDDEIRECIEQAKNSLVFINDWNQEANDEDLF